MTPKLKRRLLIALAALACLALLGPVWPGARLSVTTGSVEIGHGEPPVWKPAATGEALSAGDRVRTGDDGRAEVALDGSTLRMYPNSLLRLPEAPRNVEMERGSTLFDVIHNGDPFEVRTPEVVVSVKGTRFGVSLDADDASVSVFRGLVGVRGEQGGGSAETLVYEGFAAHGHDNFELSWHGTDDPWNGWKQGEAIKPPSRGAALRDAQKAVVSSTHELSADPKHQHRDGRTRGEHGTDGSVLPPAAIADAPPDTAEGTVVRDAVSGASAALDTTLQQTQLNNVLDQATGGLLTINFIDGSGGKGGDRVELAANADTWVFKKDDLEGIAEGDNSLPANLATVLDQQGVNDTALVSQLLSLFKKKH